MSKTCKTCKLTKDESEFYSHNPKAKTNPTYVHIHSECKVCWGKTTRAQRRVRQLENKQKAIDLLGGKCHNCSYSKNYYALDFHHIDPTQKDAQLSDLFKEAGWAKVKAEVLKCKLLCANCHREHHYPEGNVNG
jgi:hypothetical protein